MDAQVRRRAVALVSIVWLGALATPATWAATPPRVLIVGPLEHPPFDLVVNLRSAGELGLAVPEGAVARAARVIR